MSFNTFLVFFLAKVISFILFTTQVQTPEENLNEFELMLFLVWTLIPVYACSDNTKSHLVLSENKFKGI